MSISKNLDSKKTSFLNKSNSTFIEQMYLKFISNDSDLPQSWKDYFTDLGDELNLVIKEINGPSWQKTKKIDVDAFLEKSKNIMNDIEYFFAEDQGRYIIEINKKDINEVTKILDKNSVHHEKLGVIIDKDIIINEKTKLTIDELKTYNNNWLVNYMSS